MDQIKEEILVKVRFLNTDEGGRKGPILVELYKCMFGLGEELFDCGLDLSNTGPIELGQKVIVPIKFLCPELVKDRLKPGDKFYLREMDKVAEGEIISTSFSDS